MAIGGMEVFGHDYHFGAKPSYEGVSKSKGTPSHPTKGKKKGYGGPKSPKLHKGTQDYGRTKGVKDTGNEFRKAKGPQSLPTKKIAQSASGKSTANSSRGDAVKDGYSKGPQ